MTDGVAGGESYDKCGLQLSPSSTISPQSSRMDSLATPSSVGDICSSARSALQLGPPRRTAPPPWVMTRFPSRSLSNPSFDGFVVATAHISSSLPPGCTAGGAIWSECEVPSEDGTSTAFEGKPCFSASASASASVTESAAQGGLYTSRSLSAASSSRGSHGTSRSCPPPGVPKLPLHMLVPSASKEKGPVYVVPKDYSGRRHTGDTDTESERSSPPKLRLPPGWCSRISKRTGKPYYWKEGEHADSVTWIHPAKKMESTASPVKSSRASATTQTSTSATSGADGPPEKPVPAASGAAVVAGGWSSWLGSILCKGVALDEADRTAQAKMHVDSRPVLKDVFPARQAKGQPADMVFDESAANSGFVTPPGVRCQIGCNSLCSSPQAAVAERSEHLVRVAHGKRWGGVTALRRPRSRAASPMPLTPMAHVCPGEESGGESRSVTPKGHCHRCPISCDSS